MSQMNQIDALRIALEMERRGRSLYLRARQFAKEDSLRALLEKLAAEEEVHYRHFWSMLQQEGEVFTYPEESALDTAKAADVFYPGGLMQVVLEGALDSTEAMLEEAMNSERSSIEFYEKLLLSVGDESQRRVIEGIIDEERLHLAQLFATKKAYEEAGVRDEVDRESMGTLQNGTEIFRYRLKNASGASADIATLGGCLLSLRVPDRDGVLGDVLLGYDTLETMQAGEGYMGMLIGRYGNRIGGASFELDGIAYHLAKNDGENSLHGGFKGFDKGVWRVERAGGSSLTLSLISPDGEEGYPGTLSVTVTYTLTDRNALRIEYQAQTDHATILNLTNHAYFNLSGPGSASIGDHRMQMLADRFTEVADGACIPTGRLLPVEGTPFDLRAPRILKEGLSHQASDVQMQYGKGYDHNFALTDWDGTLRLACVVEDPGSGRRMETWTDQPGVQLYTGNMIAGDTPGKCGVPYVSRQGFCLETQHYPDSIHHGQFPSCVLRPGEIYRTATEYRFGVI